MDSKSEEGDIKPRRPCFLCHYHVRCRDEHVERDSKKCHNLLRLDEKKRPR